MTSSGDDRFEGAETMTDARRRAPRSGLALLAALSMLLLGGCAPSDPASEPWRGDDASLKQETRTVGLSVLGTLEPGTWAHELEPQLDKRDELGGLGYTWVGRISWEWEAHVALADGQDAKAYVDELIARLQAQGWVGPSQGVRGATDDVSLDQTVEMGRETANGGLWHLTLDARSLEAPARGLSIALRGPSVGTDCEQHDRECYDAL